MNSKTYKKNLLIPFVKLVIDVLAVESAFLFSFYLRFDSPLTRIFPITKGYPPFYNYLAASVVLLFIYLVLFSVFHSYRTRYFSTFTQDIPVVFKTCFLGIVFAMSGAFLYRGFSYSRLTLLLVFIDSLVFSLAGRFVFHRIRQNFMSRGIGLNRLILAGSQHILPRLFAQIQKKNNRNLEVLGYCSELPNTELPVPYLGNLEVLGLSIDEKKADGVCLAFDSREHGKVLEVMRMTEGKNVELFYIPDLLDMMTSRTGSLEIGGMPAIRLKGVAFSGWQGFLKRTFDIIVSLISLILALPLLMLIAVLVRLSSPGSVLYRQKRVGLDGKEFTILKFRSMMMDAEKDTGPVWAKKGDPRVTGIGNFLRRTSLDELPQLFNVLVGDMSLVGPRPERKVFVDEFQLEIPKYAERHRVRSGMTGWAQVNGLRGQSPVDERTRFDVFYIENWSLLFAIKIILMTFMAIVRGENAY
jgi:exopolysaccharide biosynthesis polyprenyl glycosylphosphotransferase